MKTRFARSTTVALLVGATCFGAQAARAQAAAEPPPASAADQPGAPTAADDQTTDQQTGDIIVTATRREETLQRVPISITARTRDDLQQRTVTRLTDVTESIPNLAMSQNNVLESTATFTIRGFSTTSNNTGVSPGVGVYVDGVYLTRNVAFDSAVNDAARIEVLRGPQGTQFGRNAAQGAISLTTLDPGDHFEGEAVAQYGSYDLIDGRVRLSGPLGDHAGVLASAYFRDRDGFVLNTTQNTRLNAESYYGGRLKFLFEPTPNVEIRISADGQRDDTTANTLDFTPIDFIVTTNGTFNGGPEFFRRTVYGFTGDVRWTIGEHQLVATSGYRHFDAAFGNDQDFTTTRITDFAGRDESGHSFSQEIRLVSPDTGRLTYIVGLYYLDQEGHTVTSAAFGPGFPIANTRVDAIADLGIKSYAAFANATFHITDTLRLIGGIRYTQDDQDFLFRQVSTVTPAIPNIAATSASRSDDQWTPLATLSWQATPNLMLYGTYSRGYKAGGFNSTLVFNSTQVSTFEPETMDNYEGGFRARIARNLTVNGTVFHQEYKNQQISVFVNPVTGFVFRNAAASRATGFELEFSARPVPNLTISGGAGYNDAEYKSFPGCSGTGNCSGNELPSPRFNANASISYEHSLGDWAIRVRADAYHQDAFYTNDLNTISATDRNLVNGRITLVTPGERFEISAFGTNIFDDRYVTPRNADFTAGRVSPLPTPAQFGVEVRARF